MHFCIADMAKEAFPFRQYPPYLHSPIGTVRSAGGDPAETQGDCKMTRITQTLVALVNVALIAGAFGVVTIALAPAFA